MTTFNVISGAEAFFIENGPVGVLICHGFIGTPQSVRDLGEGLAKKGFTVLAPRLKGHGTHYRELSMCTYKDWQTSLEKGYNDLKKYCRTIYVLGQSMGGTLTLDLVRRYPGIQGMMLINPAINVPEMEAICKREKSPYVAEGIADIKKGDKQEISYRFTPVAAIRQLLALLDHVRPHLSEIRCPALFFQSAEDHVVPPENVNFIYEHIGSSIKKKIILENSYHVASMDQELEIIIRRCEQFMAMSPMYL